MRAVEGVRTREQDAERAATWPPVLDVLRTPNLGEGR